MPYVIKHNPRSDTFKVIDKKDPKHIYAFATKNPHALIAAIEYNKHKKKK